MPDASLIRSNSQNLVSWEGTLSAHPTVAGPKALARRSFDVLIAASVLLFALPLLVTIFALLKIQEGGPALLGEWRVGRGGRKAARRASGALQTGVRQPPRRHRALQSAESGADRTDRGPAGGACDRARA